MASFSTTSAIAFPLRLAALCVLWFLLTGSADAGSWVIGSFAVFFAAVISIRLLPPTPMNVLQLLRFLPLFLLRSLLAAFDVARRTFALRLPIAPAEITYDMSLPAGAPRVVFMNTVSLLPGTLSAELHNGRLTVHVLDHGLDHAVELARLEGTIARIFPGPGP